MLYQPDSERILKLKMLATAEELRLIPEYF
jgi:hypothetical protein